MKSNMIKLGTVCLSGAISRNEAAVVAVGDDIIVADVLRSGKLRYRQILEGVKPEEIDYDAKVVVVPKAVRRRLRHLFAYASGKNEIMSTNVSIRAISVNRDSNLLRLPT